MLGLLLNSTLTSRHNPRQPLNPIKGLLERISFGYLFSELILCNNLAGLACSPLYLVKLLFQWINREHFLFVFVTDPLRFFHLHGLRVVLSMVPILLLTLSEHLINCLISNGFLLHSKLHYQAVEILLNQ